MTQKSALDRDQAVGIFVPPPLDLTVSRSIHNPGIGRVNKEIHARLWERLDNSGLSISPDLNFRHALIHNGAVLFSDKQDCSIRKYFWYCEIDRKPNGFDFSVLKSLSARMPVARDPHLYERALDKHSAFSLLRKYNVPVSETILVSPKSIHQAESLIRSWEMAVLKPRRGGYGKGVTLFNNYETLRDAIEYIEATTPQSSEGGFYLERFYENDIKDWVSVTIIDGQIVYGYRKNPDRFVSLGNGKLKVYSKDEISGGVSLCAISPLQEKIALDAYNALGLEVIGFDMLLNNGTPIIVDVNTFPGMYQDLFEEQGLVGGDLFFNMIVRSLRLEV